MSYPTLSLASGKNRLAAAFLLSLTLTLFAAFASSASANTPTLSAVATGSGDNVTLNVTGDPNASVLLYYVKAGTDQTLTSLGTTDGSGNFSTTISSSAYGIQSGTLANVITGGSGGPQSPSVVWPTITGGTNTLTLSPTSAVVNVGQSTSVNISNPSGSTLYISNNSNPPIANLSISGSTLTISGNTYGSTVATICAVGNTTNCPSVYIVVENAGAPQLSFSQSSVSLVAGQNVPITISGGSGVYTVVNNSSAGTVSESLNGSVLTLSTGSASGSSSVLVCTTDMSACGIVNVTIGSASSVTTSFSDSAPSVIVGQSTAVSIYGASGSVFYVSSNSNPSVAQANLSGTTLTITGISSGSSVISVCSSLGGCGTLTATVNYASTGGNIALSQNTLSLTSGQSAGVIISGGETPYSVSGVASAIAQATISGNVLTVYGVATGGTLLQVCSAGGGCATLSVSVNGGAVATVPATTTTTPAPTVTYSPSPSYSFSEYLAPGSQDNEVLVLQQLLAAQGYLTATPTGYFGAATEAAVLKFQAARGIEQLGVVGPSTRAALNQLESQSASVSSGTSSTNISTMGVAQLQAQAQSLESQLNAVLAQIAKLTGQ